MSATASVPTVSGFSTYTPPTSLTVGMLHYFSLVPYLLEEFLRGHHLKRFLVHLHLCVINAAVILFSTTQCHVQCFSTSGFEHAMKITLRCLHCGLFYNYAQFGNKREVGFRFYQEPREYIEANDAVFFHRKLFQFQCSLA